MLLRKERAGWQFLSTPRGKKFTLGDLLDTLGQKGEGSWTSSNLWASQKGGGGASGREAGHSYHFLSPGVKHP